MRPTHGRATEAFGGDRRAGEQRLPLRCLPELRTGRPGLWRKIMDTNLFGSLQMTRAALPSMRERRWRVGGDGGLHGGPPAPAGPGRLRHLEGRR